MANVLEVSKREHHTKDRKQRGHGRTVISVPGSMTRGFDKACEGSEQFSTLGRRSGSGNKNS